MKTRRHAKILELIQENNVDTQEELLRLLRKEGYDVTQATVSRDIKELRLVKSLDADGHYKYSISRKGDGIDSISSKFYSLFKDSVLSIEYACNMVVVKCLNGIAQGVCAAMDSMYWESVVGTLAGDDTIFIVTRSEENAAQLVKDLKKLMSSH